LTGWRIPRSRSWRRISRLIPKAAVLRLGLAILPMIVAEARALLMAWLPPRSRSTAHHPPQLAVA